MRGLNNEKRYALLDSLRGLLLLEMIVYHFFWDLVYLFEQDLPWFHSSLCYWWQQSICWRFIFLSGFCWPLGKRAVRRAVQVFGGSVLVMVITHIFVPDQAVTFGVLFFLGSGMLLLELLDRLLCRLALLFVVHDAPPIVLFRIPSLWWDNLDMTQKRRNLFRKGETN